MECVAGEERGPTAGLEVELNEGFFGRGGVRRDGGGGACGGVAAAEAGLQLSGRAAVVEVAEDEGVGGGAARAAHRAQAPAAALHHSAPQRLLQLHRQIVEAHPAWQPQRLQSSLHINPLHHHHLLLLLLHLLLLFLLLSLRCPSWPQCRTCHLSPSFFLFLLLLLLLLLLFGLWIERSCTCGALHFISSSWIKCPRPRLLPDHPSSEVVRFMYFHLNKYTTYFPTFSRFCTNTTYYYYYYYYYYFIHIVVSIHSFISSSCPITSTDNMMMIIIIIIIITIND